MTGKKDSKLAEVATPNISDSSNTPKKRSNFFTRPLGIALVVLIIIGVAGLLYKLQQPSSLAATVGGRNITKEQVKERVWYDKQFQGEFKQLKPTKEEDKAALDQLIELRLLEIQADNSNVQLSSQDLDIEMKTRKYDLSTFSPAQARISKDAIRHIVLKDRVSNNVVIAAESQEVIIPFFRYYFLDNVRYEEDKEYARALANDMYKQLKDGNLTVEQAREKAKTDPRTGLKVLVDGFGYINYSFGENLTRAEFLLQEPSPQTTLLKSSKDGVNEPKLLEQELSNPEGRDETKKKFAVSWDIVVLKGRNNGKFATYSEWLSDTKKQTKVKQY